MVTLAQAEERKRKDLKQVADYAQAMMEKEFPSMDFPNEKWARRDIDGMIIYYAHWPCRSAIRILGPFNDGTWEINFVDHPANFAIINMVRREHSLDILSVRCVAIEWTKHLTQSKQE